ncbi:phosphate ABC transporter permease PstA [Magnetospirillum sp. XM-1]|uniref:phosphate ABC transporter permease PstA n=1 Tax=Magnetospirillum sp. XM-1 TaxID=1663591 RepID=UPI000837BDA5|nr:phosphate ABC transporter permease PstA [Magnetospirillum sp. XM-1]
MADQLFTVSAWVIGLTGAALPAAIIAMLVVKGWGVISIAFLTTGPAGLPLGSSGGILPAMVGSLALLAVGSLVAVPLGIAGAVYLVEFGRNPRLLAVVRFLAECFAGIPAILWGLFGYSFLVVLLALKVSLLAGGLTLGLMMFPIVLIGADEALRAVHWQYREAALALGVTRSYVTRRVTLAKAWPGIVSASVLAAGHAFGSAAPVLYTASTVFTRGTPTLDAPVMTLATHLYYLSGEGVSFDHAFGTALVLVVVLLAVNIGAMLLKRLLRAA